MLVKIIFILFTMTLSQTISAETAASEFSDKSKLVMVVVEQANLAKGVDPILASTIGGLEAVQKNVKDAGLINCDCKKEAYTSLAFGNGFGSEGGSMQWKAFALRLGKPVSEHTRIDFIHINEGHVINNHRDGFALAAAYNIPLTENLSIELSAGPYFSMNTTTINGSEKDDKHLGLLSTLAVLYSIDRLSPGLHLRAEYNHVIMPGAITTDSFLIGVGKFFDDEKERSRIIDSKLEVNMIGDHYKTNHGNTESANGVQLELRKGLSDRTAVSFSYLNEGKDELVDRQGVAAQVWYIQPLSKSVSLSVGAGPYFADNKLDDTSRKLNGLISIELKKDLTKNTAIFIRANRIADFSGGNDRDLVGIGLEAKFQ